MPMKAYTRPKARANGRATITVRVDGKTRSASNIQGASLDEVWGVVSDAIKAKTGQPLMPLRGGKEAKSASAGA